MFDKFGNLNSVQEINELAENLRKEGDTKSLYIFARENGIDDEITEIFLSGDMPQLADEVTAAIGKIDIEEAELKPQEIMADWVEYLKARCFESEEMAIAVRKTDKSLKGMIGAMLSWSFKHQIPVEKDILKAAGVNAGRVTLGIPGMAQAKKIMSEYYLGK
ncbi:MAG: hypothetical protein J6D13_09860 [Clostridium sp.]|nr:hypothetical protein [Clostridium sp.]